jgi:hypothetical protein
VVWVSNTKFSSYLGNSKSEMFDLQDLFDGWFRQLQSHSVNEVNDLGARTNHVC